MGLFYDIASAIFQERTGEDTIAAKKKAMDQMHINSITKMAKSAIFSYPVLISEGVVGSDEDLMYAICSYLETQYAGFTLIAMGLNPIFTGTDPKSHISTFYSEETDSLIPDNNSRFDAIISMGKRGIIKITPNDLKVYRNSLEANSPPVVNRNNNNTYNNDNSVINKNNIENTNNTITSKLGKLEEKVRNSDPTIIHVTLKMAENKHTVEFPVAIKAMPRFITSQESTTIFSYLRDDKPIVRFIRLFSGEIGLFKDIILQLERAKNDKDLYAKLGRHPWFRALIQRRNKRRVNGLVQMIPAINEYINGTSTDILPICSLCVTKDEIENGFSNLWANIKKYDDNIMDKLMLLCLVVVDTTVNTVEFDFYGLKNNQIIRASSLIKENGVDKDKGKDMEKLIQSLIYKV